MREVHQHHSAYCENATYPYIGTGDFSERNTLDPTNVVYLVIKSIEWSRHRPCENSEARPKEAGPGCQYVKYNAQIYAKEETHIKLQLNGILTSTVASIVMLESPGHVISVGITGQWRDGQVFSLLVH